MPLGIIALAALAVAGLFAYTSLTRARTTCVWQIARLDGTSICVPAEIGDRAINLVAQARELCPLPGTGQVDAEGFPIDGYSKFVDAFEDRIIMGTSPVASYDLFRIEIMTACPQVQPPRF